MNATDVSVYHRFSRGERFVGMTLTNGDCHLDVKVLSYADNGLVLQRMGGYAKDSSFLRVRDVIGLITGCFYKASTFGREMQLFYGKSYQQVNAITMNIYGIHITANRYGDGPEELWKQWIKQFNRKKLWQNL